MHLVTSKHFKKSQRPGQIIKGSRYKTVSPTLVKRKKAKRKAAKKARKINKQSK